MNTETVKNIKNFYTRMIDLYKKEVTFRDETAFRLINVFEEKFEVAFQVVGTSIVIKIPASKLMRHDMLIGFSKQDIAIITNIGTRSESVPLPNKTVLKLIRQMFSDGIARVFLKNTNTNELQEKTATEIFCDSSLTEQLSPADAIKVGYSAAEERYLKILESSSQKVKTKLMSIDNEKIIYKSLMNNETYSCTPIEAFSKKEILDGFCIKEQLIISYNAGELRQRISLIDQ